MSIFIDPNRSSDYVLKEQVDLPKNEQIVFQLKILTARDYADLQNAIQGKDAAGQYETKWGSYTYEMVRRGLSGWKGKDAPKFALDDAGLVSDASMDVLSAAVRTELANAIDKANSTSEDDTKN